MKLKTIKSEGITHNSYFLSDEGEAVVIDQRRDCQIYTRLACAGRRDRMDKPGLSDGEIAFLISGKPQRL